MVSFAASRVGHSMLSFELASRSRSLAFTVVSVERQRQHPQNVRQFHSVTQPSTFRAPSHEQSSQRHRSAFQQPFSTQPSRLQQAAATQSATSTPTPPPLSQSTTPPPSRPQSTTTTTTTSSSTRQASQTPPESDVLTDITASGLQDAPPPPAYTPEPDPSSTTIDWARSFHGLSTQPFSEETSKVLLAPVESPDVEIKPDGIIYLPEIKYRRILNRAFGPGGWGLAPRSETIITAKFVTREYALLAHGRLVSVARGEQEYFDREGIPTATEGCKSNALMRCCKDLGVASELWDPRFIRKFMKESAKEVWVEHVTTKKRRKITLRKEDSVGYPWKEVKLG